MSRTCQRRNVTTLEGIAAEAQGTKQNVGRSCLDVDMLIICFRCGQCCIGRQVRLTTTEAKCIAQGLRTAWEDFLQEYVDPSWPGDGSYLLRTRDKACIFLQHAQDRRETRCLVHSFKPSACRLWTPSLYRHECSEGLAKYWDLTVNAVGQLDGSEERLRDFRRFLESLSEEDGGTNANLRVQV